MKRTLQYVIMVSEYHWLPPLVAFKVTRQSREVENFWPLSFGHVFILSIWLHHQKIRKFYQEELDLQVVSNCS